MTPPSSGIDEGFRHDFSENVHQPRGPDGGDIVPRSCRLAALVFFPIRETPLENRPRKMARFRSLKRCLEKGRCFWALPCGLIENAESRSILIMKAFKTISTGLLFAVLTLCQPKAIGQDQITKETMTRESGIWFAESINMEGEKVNHYSWYAYVDELDLGRGVHFNVNAETKEFISSLHVYTTVGQSGKQTESLWFNSNGSVGTSVGLIDGHKTIIRFQGVNTNNVIHSGTIKKQFSEDFTRSHETWNDMVFDGNYVESTPKRESRKLAETNLMSLFQNGEIVLPENRGPANFLKPLENLIGNWEWTHEKGDFSRRIQWRVSGMGALLVEKFDYLNDKNEINGGGINITGMDPSSGQLTIWSVGKNGFQRRGGWDVLSDKVTGQRQNNDRIIRRFENNDTVTVYWQSKKNGEYSGESGKYTLKRVLEAQ